MEYEKIGFKCGIEIHQQLETNKLFCDCPSIVHDKNPDIFFERRLRAVIGETGIIDAAAAHEQSKHKTYKYEACSTSSCLIEMDEEPPRPVNNEALLTALQVAKALNCKIVDEVQFMRKTVIDGSNVSGFQRTGLIGMNGLIVTPLGKVKVDSVCLEEESAKKIDDGKDYVNYRLDRLGVALIEVATDASIKSPEHAKEVAAKIGMVLRSTAKVKRGIGTIRQDVNISIKGGDRTEIKGFQDLKSITKIIDFEIKRQQKLIAKGEKIEKSVRKAESDFTTKFLRPMPGAARMYPETDVVPVKITKEMLNNIDSVELIEDKIINIVEKYHINNEQATFIINNNIEFESYCNKYNIDPKTIASSIIDIPKDIKTREKLDIALISDSNFQEIFQKIKNNEISNNKDTIREILIQMISKPNQKIDYSKYKPLDTINIEKEIIEIINKNKGAPIGAIMGQVMAKFRGKVDGKTVNELVKKNL